MVSNIDLTGSSGFIANPSSQDPIVVNYSGPIMNPPPYDIARWVMGVDPYRNDEPVINQTNMKEHIKTLDDLLGEINAKAVKDMLAEVITGTNIETIKRIKKHLNDYFGEANNQIIRPDETTLFENLKSMHSESTYIGCKPEAIIGLIKRNAALLQFTVIIRFPEVEMTNSHKSKHTIKDLWVKFEMKSDCTMQYNLWGMRSTLSKEEAASGYMHSHLHTTTDPHWNAFCRGTGEINQIMASLAKEYTDPGFVLFCLNLKTFVAWESLEGTPYTSISNIGNNRSSSNFSQSPYSVFLLGRRTSEGTIDKFFRLLKSSFFGRSNEEITKGIDLIVTTDNVTVSVTPEGERAMVTMIESVVGSDNSIIHNSYGDSLFSTKIGSQYYALGSSDTRQMRSGKTLLKFKGEDIKLTILNQEKDETTRQEKLPNPFITKEFCKRLTDSFIETVINYESSGWGQSSTQSIIEVAKPDIFPMQSVS